MALTETQRKLADEHLSLVRALAAKAKEGLSPQIEFDDLVAYGAEGLMEAAERFDPKLGYVFSTFAYYRIRGAIYDGLRRMGWLSRTEYARHRADERANQYLQSQSDREAGTQGAAPKKELADEVRAVGEVLDGLATIYVTSLDAREGAELPGASQSAPEALEAHEGQVRVRAAVKSLPEKERRLMEMYYFEEKTLEEAGKALGLSKSWACRLHARAVDLLRDAMGDG